MVTNNPVGYLITCQVAEWEGRNAVVINQGGQNTEVGYSIWSKDDLDRIINELRVASSVAWPTLVEYEIDPNNPPPLTAAQQEELARLRSMPEHDDEASPITRRDV